MKAKDYGLSKQDIMEMSDRYLLDIGYHFPIVVEEGNGMYRMQRVRNTWISMQELQLIRPVIVMSGS